MEPFKTMRLLCGVGGTAHFFQVSLRQRTTGQHIVMHPPLFMQMEYKVTASGSAVGEGVTEL